MVHTIGESLRFMETLTGCVLADINRVDFFASHEGLHLSMSRPKPARCPGAPVGMISRRTFLDRRPDSRARWAHIEYFRGIANPIGMKIGPSVTPDEALALAGALNPRNEPGRLTLIPRSASPASSSCLPPIADAMRRAGKAILWCCDPMHGNTETPKTASRPALRQHPQGTRTVLSHPQRLRNAPWRRAFRANRR